MFCFNSSPTYQLASKSKNKSKEKDKLGVKEAPLVDPEPTSDISALNAPLNSNNGNISSTDVQKPPAKALQSILSSNTYGKLTFCDKFKFPRNFDSFKITFDWFIFLADSASSSPLATNAPCELVADEDSLNQQQLPANLTLIYGKCTQNRRTEEDRKIVLYILAADENHRNEKSVLNSLYADLQQYCACRGFELQLCDLHERCDNFLDPACWIDEPLEARGGHHLGAECLSEISSKKLPFFNFFEYKTN